MSGHQIDIALARQPVLEKVDVDEYEAFVKATGRRMHRAALLLCGGDHHLAEDLTQMTYTKVYASWRRVHSVEDPVAYTRKMLTRTYLSNSRIRRNSERPTGIVIDSAVIHPETHEVRLDLLAAIREISPQDRAVLVLRYYEDRSVAETALILGITESATRQRASRALKRLRDLRPDLNATEANDATQPSSTQELP